MKRFAFLFSCALVLWFPRPSAAAAITLLPTSSSVLVGESFTLDVAIADAIDLFAYQFDINFDPALFSAGAVSDGGFLTSAGGTSVFTFLGLGAPFVITLDNVAGIVSIADSLLGPAPPASGVTGDGVLASLSFTAIGGGVGGLTLSNLILEDSVGTLLAADFSSASVEAMPSPTPVPEPASLALVASGALALYWSRRRSR